jgi:hypothetical protein
VWARPVALSIDNITFGVIDGHWTTSVCGQAGEQALSSRRCISRREWSC